MGERLVCFAFKLSRELFVRYRADSGLAVDIAREIFGTRMTSGESYGHYPLVFRSTPMCLAMFAQFGKRA